MDSYSIITPPPGSIQPPVEWYQDVPWEGILWELKIHRRMLGIWEGIQILTGSLKQEINMS